MPQNPESRHVSDTSDRREFMKLSALAGLGAAVGHFGASSAKGQDPPRVGEPLLGPAPRERFKAPPIENVRIGFVGVGGMGSGHVRNLLRIPGCTLTAVCDIVPERVKRVQDWVVDAGFPNPKGYSDGNWDFLRLCEQDDVDLVYNATPWRWHVPICVAAMENGKHAATEVPAAVTMEECWKLVETAEKTKRHCMMMENCCYNRQELLTLNLVRKGLLGELLYAECGYLHDLRGIKFSDGGEGLWRRDHSWTRDGNLYPTHGLGPIAQCMDINRGDQLDYLVSMSSPSRGLQAWAREHYPADHPKRKETFALGDVNVCLIKTKLGRVIQVVHDTNLPRPYSRINMLQGVKGLVRCWPNEVHIEGISKPHQWQPMSEYYAEHEHPLWKSMQEKAKGAGHGGMDYIEDYRLVQCLRRGEPTDQDVYDAAAWSVISELTERSVANRGQTQDVPDFTRGRWKVWEPWPIVDES
jgi:hypothetical protein